MPNHLKALVVILVLSTVVFLIARAPACAVATTPADFARRRNLWFGLTLAAFLAHNYWIYIIVAAVLLRLALAREQNKLAMFFFSLLALPKLSAEIPGFGVVNLLFVIDYYRLLSLVVLLPAYLYLRRQPDTEHFGRLLPDKLLIGYLFLQFVLMFTNDTFTNTLRNGAFYVFLDIFLPYYVASRSLRNLQGFRDALMAFVVAALVLSLIAVFEFTWHWLLYTNLDEALGVKRGGSGYLERGGYLRAEATAGQAIPLGYAIAVATGFFYFLRKSVPNPALWGLGLILLIMGLIVPISRGPWVGAVAIFLGFIATGRSPLLNLTKLGLLALIAIPVLLASPVGDAIIDRLPFVGSIEEHNVTYRERLLEVSIEIIMENPFFGSSAYSPALDELKSGAGLVDVVNTFAAIGMSKGLVGLSLFAGFFIAIGVGIFKGMRSLADRSGEVHLLGQALLSTLLGIMLIIFTVSSVGSIPVIYWSVAGLGVAYARMLALAKSPLKVPESAERTGIQPSTIKNKSYYGHSK